jgi:serine phosphatase RsbU (regulator of sigma subunit)
MALRFVDLRRSPRAAVLLPVALLITIVVVDVLAPPHIHLGPLLVAAPAITPAFGGARLTAFVALLAVAAQAVIAVLRDDRQLFSANHQAQIVALVVVGASLVLFCLLRERRNRELRQVRHVSETAQRLILRPLPKRIGPLRVASLYLGAEAEARIGGDVYAVERTDSSTRLLIGDARGKGMPLAGEAALLLDAFHLAGHRQAPLDALAAHLNSSVTWSLADGAESDEPGESFITAAIVEIPDEDDTVRMVDCGHPPPILVRDGRVSTVEAPRPAPPMGLGELSAAHFHVEEFTLGAGDRLLLYTDGITEARDPEGVFYPLAARMESWTDCHVEALLHHLKRDLLAHTGGRLGDDAALVAVERQRTSAQ